MPKTEHRQYQRSSAADERQHSAAGGDVQAEREEDLRSTGDQQVDTEEGSRDDDGMFRQNVYQDAKGERQNPGQQGRLPQMRHQLWNSSGFHAWIFPQTAIAVGDLREPSGADPLGCLGGDAAGSGIWLA